MRTVTTVSTILDPETSLETDPESNRGTKRETEHNAAPPAVEWPTFETDQQRQQQVADRFRTDTADHLVTVVHDHDGHRHLRVQSPGSGFYWFDIMTSPDPRSGTLTFNGDMGTYVFSRVEDMFEFFRGGDVTRINPGYWAEKVLATSGTTTFSRDRVLEEIHRYLEDYSDPSDPAGHADLVRSALGAIDNGEMSAEQTPADIASFSHGDFEFYDSWEWDLTTYTTQYLWACYAIKATIAAYDGAQGATSFPLNVPTAT